MEKKPSGKSGFIILLILAVCAGGGLYQIFIAKKSIPSNLSAILITNNFFEPNKMTKKITPVRRSDYIAVLSVKGVIERKNKTYDQKWLLDTIEELRTDPWNKGLMLDIDSPGGGVFEADAVYLALESYKETGKPLWAYLEQMAASGGYYIACAADSIYANRNTLTGSIGVLLGPALDLTGLMEKYGIKMTTFTSGKNKNMLGINSTLSAEQYGIMQSIVDEAYNQFVEVVALGRNLPEYTVRKIADGRIYTALQAEKNKLIDGISSYEAALDKMIEECFTDSSRPATKYLEPKTKQTFYDFLTETESILSGKFKEDFFGELLEEKLTKTVRPSYLFIWGNE